MRNLFNDEEKARIYSTINPSKLFPLLPPRELETSWNILKEQR